MTSQAECQIQLEALDKLTSITTLAFVARFKICNL